MMAHPYLITAIALPSMAFFICRIEKKKSGKIVDKQRAKEKIEQVEDLAFYRAQVCINCLFQVVEYTQSMTSTLSHCLRHISYS
jgi:hypothetical protein